MMWLQEQLIQGVWAFIVGISMHGGRNVRLVENALSIGKRVAAGKLSVFSAARMMPRRCADPECSGYVFFEVHDGGRPRIVS